MAGRDGGRRHGSWPLYVPPTQPSEAWWLAEQIAAPITPECDCDCCEGCDCPDGVCKCETTCSSEVAP